MKQIFGKHSYSPYVRELLKLPIEEQQPRLINMITDGRNWKPSHTIGMGETTPTTARGLLDGSIYWKEGEKYFFTAVDPKSEFVVIHQYDPDYRGQGFISLGTETFEVYPTHAERRG